MGSVVLTMADRRKLERICANQLSWNDTGYWQGVGSSPNCFQRENYKSSIIRIFNFSSDESANRWNASWEREIRNAGHIGTMLLTLAVTLISSSGVGAIVGTLAAMMKDELQSKIHYPKMERGWSCRLCLKHEYYWSPQYAGRNGFTQTIIAKVVNHNGEVISQHNKKYSYKLDRVPQQLAIKLSKARNTTRTVNF